MPADNRRIAKNTMILYFRQILGIVVSLYTSRIVLQSLGVTDYGVYGLVGGVVGFMGFLNATLAVSSSRFITFALGEGDLEKSKRTFTTTLTVHVILGLIILLIGEVVGIYMLYNQLNIPEERLSSAFIALQFSLATTALGISQVPYSACMSSHEDFSLVAYFAIWDVIQRLLIALGIMYYKGDRLVLFSGLLFANAAGVMLFIRYYCSYRYKEAKFKLHIDKELFKKIATFSGWNLLYQFAYTLNAQGTTVLIGMFFNPAVVAAKSISVRINTMTTQFIGQFRAASAPQIVKMYAQNDYQGLKKLLLMSGKYSFFIMWIMTLPICLLADPLLALWLDEVPEYAVIFCQLIMIDSLFWLFDVSFNQGIIATGKMKMNTIWTGACNLLRFPFVYLFFLMGFSPVSSFVISILFGAIVGCVLKPFLLMKLIAGFKIMDFITVYLQCFIVACVSAAVPYLAAEYLDTNTIEGFVAIGALSVLSAISAIFYLGVEKQHRKKIINYLQIKFLKW